jgi:hypothetical protein
MKTTKQVVDARTGVIQTAELSEEEQASLEEVRSVSGEIEARSKRDSLLVGSDWRVVADATWDTTAWATYRQQLRDLPSNPSWPYVDFPDPPGGANAAAQQNLPT